jgi:sulfur-oxidizing protein SoxY
VIQHRRRDFLKHGGLLAALASGGLLSGREAWAGSGALAFEEELAFGAVSMDEALRGMGGIPAQASQIVFTLPELVENGAVVPVSVESKLRGTREIFIVVEANPNPMAARFTIPDGTEPFVATRIKVAQTCSAFALVRADGKLYSASRLTKVTIGGCG